MRELFDTPGEGRILLGYLEHTVWTLATDLDDGGTNSEVFKTEGELRLAWLEKLAEHDVADAPEELGSDEWEEFVDEHRKDSLDTFNWNEEVLKIPVYVVDT